ncbi:MAG: hypothetical protein QM820_42570 [Minicystis sp.]
MNRILSRALAASAALAVAAPSGAALADDDGLYGPSRPAPSSMSGGRPVIVATPGRDIITFQETTPNGALIGSGALMLGLSYGGSIVVAAASDRQDDQHLYIPVVGPWMDIANREPCRGYDCGANETANKIMLVTDGVFQGVGMLQIVGGFLFPETRTITRAVGVHVTPTVGKNMLGLTASGSF